MTQEKVFEKLAAIQAALKAPKSQYNEFGRYKYRKAEDILEAVKPLLYEQHCALTCTDELQLIGSRYYIKATATLIAFEDGSTFSTCAYAREEEEKKGMDGSQVTGASSSYARKYALNGLLCIDDTADSDTTNVGEQKPAKKTPGKAAKTDADATKPAAGTEPQPEKKTAPVRGSADWAKWVKAVATNPLSKQGKQVNWIEAFKNLYHWDADMIDALEYDAFNFRMDAEHAQA